MRPVTPFRVFAALLAFAAPFAFAHSGAEAAEARLAPGEVLSTWTWDPFILAPLVLMAAFYAAGALKIRRGENGARVLPLWQLFSFLLGWMALAFALVSPLHRMGEELFSAHMTQHEVLMLIAAPLIAISQPMFVSLWALSPTWRNRIAAFSRGQRFRYTWHSISAPVTVLVIHAVALWTWHIPALYEATLRHEWVHALQHISFFGTALLFWWTLVHGRYGKLGYGTSVLFVFATALHSSILGALLTFAPSVIYPIYNGRTAAWHLTGIQDQQLGGLIMWVPSGVVFIVIGLALFAAWVGDSEKRVAYTRAGSLMAEMTAEAGQ